MRTRVRTLILLATIAILPRAAWAQVTLAGTVKDASGAVLPGVTVEASSPVLIEKTRSATSDATGQYRIESLQPGAYVVTFTLSGFSTLKREGVELSGTGVVKIDADMKVGGVAETITVTGETPVVDVQSTRRDVTLDSETMRNLPSVRNYSYLLTAVPGLQTNNNNVNTGPVFAIFPVHGGRGVESRLTVDGLNVSNPPGGNQPPNFTADIGNAQEVTMTTSGGLAETETAGLTMNIVPKQGGNTMAGLFFVSGFSQGMQSNNYTPELQASGVTQPTPVYHVYDVNGSVGGPILKDKLWYFVSVREQGQRQNTLNVFYNQNAGNPNAWTYVPDLNSPAYSDRMWENYTPSVTYQASARNKFSFRWDEQPVCRTCTGTTSLTGSPNFIFPTSPEADGHGEFSPQRVVQGRWSSPVTNKLLLEAGFGTTYYQWGGRELSPNPTENLIQVTNIGQQVGSVSENMRYRSQSWLDNFTSGTNYTFTASYVTGSHSMKFGYQGDLWTDNRQFNVNTQSLAYTFVFGAPVSISEYANGYNVNADAAQASLFAQDQWTLKRLTLQAGVRWDHPWSWFPAQTEPASAFFPGVSLASATGVTGLNDITPRFGAAYDVFGNGKTALKVNVGKYLQGASVSNLAYGANPSLRIPGGSTSAGIFAPSISRTWTDTGTPATNPNYYTPQCNLSNPAANGACGPASISNFGSTQLVGAQFDPSGLSGWGVRPSDWSYGVSVQQELFPRASVEVGYYRRTFTMYTTGGTVTENLAIPANGGVQAYTFTAPTDPRLPGGGGYALTGLYNTSPTYFGQSNLLITPTSNVGDDTRVFNGVDLTFNVRGSHGFTFSGGTSTGKVTNNYCAVESAAQYNYLNTPFSYCNQESPWQTAFRGLATYMVPRIDVILSGVYQDKANVSTDQLGSLSAMYTLTPADMAQIATQLGRPMTAAGAITVNLLAPGQEYGPRIRQLDFSIKKAVSIWNRRLTAGLDILNVTNNNVALAFNTTFTPGVAGFLSPTSYMNPRVFRLSAQFAW